VHGAPVQCTKGKCPKAFHISCARNGVGIVFNEHEAEKEVPASTTTQESIDVEGDVNPPHALKVVKKSEFHLLCAQHNPVRPLFITFYA
jgi:hypothetical protein